MHFSRSHSITSPAVSKVKTLLLSFSKKCFIRPCCPSMVSSGRSFTGTKTPGSASRIVSDIEACRALGIEYTVTASGSLTLEGNADVVDSLSRAFTGIVDCFGPAVVGELGVPDGEGEFTALGLVLADEVSLGRLRSGPISILVSTSNQRFILELWVAVQR